MDTTDFRSDFVILSKAESEISSADATIARFAEQLLKDAQYAFEWGQSAVEAAASRKAWTDAQQILTTAGPHGQMGTTDRLVKLLRAEVERRSTRVPQSTSPLSNNAEAHLSAAYAQVLRYVTGGY